MNIEIENIVYHPEIFDASRFDISGLGEIEVNESDWNLFIEACNGELPYDEESVTENDGEEEMSSMIWHRHNGKIFINPSGLSTFLCFLSWAREQDREIHVWRELEHLSWIWHDHFHAENHISDSHLIEIPWNAERDALIHGIQEFIRFTNSKISHSLAQSLHHAWAQAFSNSASKAEKNSNFLETFVIDVLFAESVKCREEVAWRDCFSFSDERLRRKRFQTVLMR